MTLPMRLERGYSSGDLVQREWNSMLNRLFGGGFGALREEQGALTAHFDVDIREDEDHIYVEADLPGFRKEDVQITLENGMLTISAERRDEAEEPERGERAERGERRQRAGQGRQGERDGNYLLHERRYQRVMRSFTLPPNVDEQNVRAALGDGVLHVVLDKREETKPRRIEVS